MIYHTRDSLDRIGKGNAYVKLFRCLVLLLPVSDQACSGFLSTFYVLYLGLFFR
jgi:hypothetical protein